MKRNLRGNTAATSVIDYTHEILNSLCDLKSAIEGTKSNQFQCISLSQKQLSSLHRLTVSHTSGNIQEQRKAMLAEKVMAAFEGQVKKLLYACVLTCPWFAGSQYEVSEQAKNNLLYVVYVSRDEQFFSLASQEERRSFETYNEGHLLACDACHFCALVKKANVRAIEALCSPPEAVIYSSPEWTRLTNLIDPLSLLNHKFVSSCLGQAMGAIVEKTQSVSGQMVLRDDVTLRQFCDSFRLLNFAKSAVERWPIPVWFDVGRNEEEKKIVKLLTDASQGQVCKEKLLQHVLTLKERIDEKIEQVPKAHPQSQQLGKWLTELRMEGITYSLHDPFPDSADPHREFLDSLGLRSIHSRDIIVIAKAGSHMYNLALPDSDTDYIVIFRQPTDSMVSSISHAKDAIHRKSYHARVDVTAHECRLFCETLLKGSVNAFELLFADNLYYSSDYWTRLISYRNSFASEHVIVHYIGFIKKYLKFIRSGKNIGTPEDAKNFYLVFHKLLSLESFVQGGPPVVSCDGKDQECLLEIRYGLLEDKLDREQLLFKAENKLRKYRDQLMTRVKRFPEHGDYHILQTWLLAVRGITLNEHLLN